MFMVEAKSKALVATGTAHEGRQRKPRDDKPHAQPHAARLQGS